MVIEAPARAKINLALKVLGKRPDGYHEVEMVMQTVELHDIMVFYSRQEGIELRVEGSDLSAGEDNLVCKAARLLEARGGGQGVLINLKKNIPLAAGLGGGSADAATTLRTLNEMWGINLSLAELMRLGENLGADVPFCLQGGTALARGKGERLSSLSPCPRLGVVLVKPPFGVSTASVYGAFKLRPGLGKVNTGAMVRALQEGDVAGIARNLSNDLEAVTIKMHPEIAAIKEKLLKAGAMGSLMSGSGPTVFGLTPDLHSAREVAGRCKNNGEQVIVTEISGG